MSRPMTTERAREIVHDALVATVPGADVDSLEGQEDLREALELDSLDFLAFVEQLGNSAGVRIDEDDYDRLTSLASAAAFLTEL